MRIKAKQLAKIMRNCEDDAVLKQLVRHIFSFKENIDTFSYFCFPEAIATSVPKFHYEIYEMLLNDESGAIAAPRGHGKSTISGLVFLPSVL